MKIFIRTKWLSKLSLTLAISLQLIATPMLTYAQSTPPTTRPDLSDLTPDQKAILDVADRIERGEEIPLTDPFRLIGQQVEVFNGAAEPVSRYKLDRPTIGITKFGFTAIRARLDRANKALIIEATRGENEKGENGVIVARQTIYGIDGVALAQDREILSIIDSQGRLHAVDWGYVVSQAFRSPIPVHTNLWVPEKPMDLSRVQVRAAYMTAGTAPFRSEDTIANAVLPRGANNEVELRAGDLLVSIKESDAARAQVMGVYAREVTHQRIADGSKLLEMQGAILARDSEYLPLLSEELKKQEEAYEKFEQDLKRLHDSTTDPMIALAIQAFGKEQLKALSERSADHRDLRARDRDWFTLKEWETRFAKIRENAEKDFPGISPEKLVAEWQSFALERKPGDKPLVLESSSDDIHKTPNSFYWKQGGVIALITAYMMAPAAIEHYESLRQIAAINYLYDYAFPAVLKDANYRWPLIASTVVLTGLWVKGVIASMVTGKALTVLNKFVQNGKGKVSQTIRDLAKNWSGLTNWQRITSFGMRVYSELILGVWITGVERLARQKTFYTAINNGVSPFTRVLPKSELGQRLNLKKSISVGFMNPFTSSAKTPEAVNVRVQALSELKAQKDRLKAQAWILSAIAVAEHYGVDMTTLLTLQGEGNPKLEQLTSLLNDPKKTQEWELLFEDLTKKLKELPHGAKNGDFSKISKDELREQYELAKASAERIIQLDPTRRYLKALGLKAKRWSLGVQHEALNLGRENFDFLKTVYTNKYVSTQVEREFVNDHLLMVYLPAMIGARADLSHPDKLTAVNDPSLGFTTPQHWTDIGYNTYIHFFVAGARLALMYQQVKPDVETKYGAIEDIARPLPKKEAGIVKSLVQWVSDSVNPKVGDMGGLLVKQWHRSITTIQAFIISSMITRLYLGQQSLGDAAFASGLMWLAGTWYYGWIWLPAQGGFKAMSDKWYETTRRTVAARRHILWGLRHGDAATKDAYLNKGIGELRSLYIQHNPKAYAEAEKAWATQPVREGLSALETQGEQMLELSETVPPKEFAPHSGVGDIAVKIAAGVSTYLAIPLVVLTFDPSQLNWSTLGWWAGVSAGLTAGAWLTLGKTPWEYMGRKSEELGITSRVNKAIEKIKSPIKRLCRMALGSDAEKK